MYAFMCFWQEMISLSRNPCHITPEEYFDASVDLAGRDIGRPIEQSTKTQRFKAQMCLCEDYPLSLPEQVVPIIDLMAASNAHFRKLKDFITLQLPSGFPVKIGWSCFHCTDKFLMYTIIIVPVTVQLSLSVCCQLCTYVFPCSSECSNLAAFNLFNFMN
jgi:GPCR-chaperone